MGTVQFLHLLDVCQKRSAILEDPVETVQGQNIPSGNWFQKSIIQVDWGRYLR